MVIICNLSDNSAVLSQKEIDLSEYNLILINSEFNASYTLQPFEARVYYKK